MRFLSVTALLLALFVPGFSQNQHNKWYFGYNAAIDFNSG